MSDLFLVPRARGRTHSTKRTRRFTRPSGADPVPALVCAACSLSERLYCANTPSRPAPLSQTAPVHMWIRFCRGFFFFFFRWNYSKWNILPFVGGKKRQFCARVAEISALSVSLHLRGKCFRALFIFCGLRNTWPLCGDLPLVAAHAGKSAIFKKINEINNEAWLNAHLRLALFYDPFAGNPKKGWVNVWSGLQYRFICL